MIVPVSTFIHRLLTVPYISARHELAQGAIWSCHVKGTHVF